MSERPLFPLVAQLQTMFDMVMLTVPEEEVLEEKEIGKS